MSNNLLAGHQLLACAKLLCQELNKYEGEQTNEQMATFQELASTTTAEPAYIYADIIRGILDQADGLTVAESEIADA